MNYNRQDLNVRSSEHLEECLFFLEQAPLGVGSIYRSLSTTLTH
jgi:hypothetical protein